MTVAEFRAGTVGADFPAAEVPAARVSRAIAAARGEFGRDDDETLAYLAAHRIVTDASDPAAVDHGAGLVSGGGQGGVTSTLDVGHDVDKDRSKFGREYLRRIGAMVAGA